MEGLQNKRINQGRYTLINLQFIRLYRYFVNICIFPSHNMIIRKANKITQNSCSPLSQQRFNQPTDFRNDTRFPTTKVKMKRV